MTLGIWQSPGRRCPKEQPKVQSGHKECPLPHSADHIRSRVTMILTAVKYNCGLRRHGAA
eukprot:CAMPEP_0181178672 /NCGR_PEP_ID=MMETSP1096-20121128/5843_1 /TAXON_ID=156174 ORGANISM="Chrysochromulina ericina, Strain CCMP281" /NCGR_SAMPLE_ID=MMETSP1096 /ASSEMBLY_ACC=CAM_ASM_000453 /LENGTH=59 /DNA_ID=CAMNT_0023266953 /DNA_START=66 /DNA_END=245 /DNA_ORIENTATION=+